MDFISNLIKRPISLVLPETPTATDKSPISSSLPNPANRVVDDQHQQQPSNSELLPPHPDYTTNNPPNCDLQRPASLSLSSSFNGNFTDFIGVPDELEDFDDFLPPPPPLLSASDLLASPMDNNNLETQTPSPPPPPLTPSMMASQTIDELLSEISDNLTLAGINDEVLAIASPRQKTELSPLASKASLNNSHTGKTPTINGGQNAAAGSAATSSSAVFEANSTLHKFHVDPELETGLFDDQQHHISANDIENTSGVNKSSNKFVGLTEFDEAKIPELPGDLNPNIEEQYNVTFEECFIPTLTAQQGSKVPEELAVEKTHLLLPNEVDNTSISSANDTFSDCQDDNAEDKDPLTTTYAEKEEPTLNTTTEGECYQSAIQDDSKVNIADLTMDAGQIAGNKTQVAEENPSATVVQQPQCDEDEPMDVDLNATIEMIQNSAGNIQSALQHAEHILQTLDEKELSMDNNREIEEVKVIGSLAKQTESSKMTFVINAAGIPSTESSHTQHLEIEQSQHDVSLNKSIELPMNKVNKTISSECVITAVNNDIPQEKEKTQTLNRSIELALNAPENASSECAISATNTDIPQKDDENQNQSLNKSMGSTENLSSESVISAANNDIPQKDEENQSLPVNTPENANAECAIAAANNDMPQNNEQTQSLNKSIELSTNMADISNSGMALEKEEQQSSIQAECPNVIEELPSFGMDNKNLTINTMNISASSNSSTKSPNSKADAKLNLTTNLSTSTSSLKSSAPNSPSFPIKQTLNGSQFPKSPKSKLENTHKPTFLEKSDYVRDLESKITAQANGVAVNGGVGMANQHVPIKNRLTFGVEPLSNTNQSDKRLTFSVATSEAKDGSEHLESKRLTFNVQSSDPLSQTGMSFPTKNKPENTRRTFCLNDVSETSDATEINAKDKIDSRLTFNIPSEAQQSINMDTSFEPMDVDDTFAQNATMSIAAAMVPLANSSSLTSPRQSQAPDTQTRFQSPALPNAQQSQPQQCALPTMLGKATQSAGLESSQPPSLASMPSQSADSPPLPNMQAKSISPPLTTIQNRSDSPPLPTMQKRTQSPPLPAALQQKTQSSPPFPQEDIQLGDQSPPLSTCSETASVDIKQEQFTPPELSREDISQSPPLRAILKRPSIHGFGADLLSAKEQSNIKNKDEKDEFVEKFTPSPVEDMFTPVSATSTTLTNTSGFSGFDQSSSASNSASNDQEHQVDDDEFQGNNNLILNPSDFDYLLTKGNNNTPVDRSSLLLKFDPLLGVPVPINQGQQQQLHLQIPTNINNNPCLSPTIEEDEHNESTNRSFVVDNAARPPQVAGVRGVAAGPASSLSAKLLKERSQQEGKQQLHHNQQIKRQLPQPGNKKNATMSVDVIKDMSLDNNDCNKTFENSNSTQPDDKQINYKMDELEKKIKNEVLKTEDIEKKLKDAEQREEALIKRITEKDKTVAKMNGVIEAYEKAIAELIAEKEQLIQNYEKQLAEVKADRDSNYHHLTSLETTFSDLHVKYEKSKEMTCHLKSSEEGLITENRKNLENLRLQEQRYDKMKNHAMQQLEIANKKLECLTREHAMESTKLKALLKKEEIARSSMSEQLAQKSKENAELVKICDELISGQGS